MTIKPFLKTCPFVALTILLSLAVAGTLGVQGLVSGPPATDDVPPLSAAASSAAPSAASAVMHAALSSLPAVSSASMAASSSVISSSAAPETPASSTASSAAALQSAPVKSPPFQTVGKDYFSDALFVGDSLTEDLEKYGDLSSAHYFCHVGLNIYQLFERPQTSAFTGLTFEQTLRTCRYRKIYIMLGINEMGTGSTAYFARHYAAAVAKIRALQPNAIIYVESILSVTKEKSEQDKIFNNPNIRSRNDALKALANGRNVFYLDMNPPFYDGSGNLRSEYSGDGVHLKARYYPLWKAHLLENAVPYENASFP